MSMMKKVKTNNNIKKFKCHKKIRKFQLFNPKTKKNFNHKLSHHIYIFI